MTAHLNAAIECIPTHDDWGKPCYKAVHKTLAGLNTRTHTAHGATHAEAIARAYEMAICTHDFRLNAPMRLRKCMKCRHTEYIR